jgi:nucleoside-diphosphate-sugar epimerase
VRRCLEGVEAVIHTASLHKPHIGRRLRSDFVETNISGTLNLLEEAAATGIGTFVFTSTTSAYGDALTPPSGSCSVDHRASQTVTEEHIRSDEDGRRGPVRALQPLALEIGAKGYDARTARHGARIAGGDRSCREADVMKVQGDPDRPAPSRQVPC